jgi:thiamine-phosphate pyrophosphorylase
MRTLTDQYGAQLIINDRVDIALSTGADGVHLGRQSIATPVVRALVPEHFLIGVSTHSLSEAREAEQGGADFITFGPVYKTPSKMKYGVPPGLSALKEVCEKVNLPVLALGGVNKKEKIKEIKASGAFGIALISTLIQAEDAEAQAIDFINELEKYNDTY